VRGGDDPAATPRRNQHFWSQSFQGFGKAPPAGFFVWPLAVEIEPSLPCGRSVPARPAPPGIPASPGRNLRKAAQLIYSDKKSMTSARDNPRSDLAAGHEPAIVLL
jgi:hypothetical protein